MNFQDLVTSAPFVAAILVAAGCVVVDVIVPGRRGPLLVVALGGLAVVGLLTLITGSTPATAFGGSYRVDDLTTFLDIVFIGIVAMTLLFAPDYLDSRRLPLAEFAAVLLFAMTGAMLLAASADLLVLFIALELMVLPGYLLAGYHKSDGYSTEGAIKYFLLGSFSSAIFLFGLAFVWGLTGTTRISEVAAALTASLATGALPAGLALGLAFLTTGVAFKIAAVPFHYWTPDAYQGSPTPVTGYLSVGPKVGAFAIISALQKRAGVTSNLDTFAGLGRREPAMGILMTLFLLSLTGIPPTAGFFAKAYVILAAVQASQDGAGVLGLLAVIAVLNAAAAAFYYLRVVVYMFMREPTSDEPPLSHGRLMWVGLVITTVLTVVFGLIPGPLLEVVGNAARAIG